MKRTTPANYTEKATGLDVTLTSLFIWTPYVTYRILRYVAAPAAEAPVVELIELDTGLAVKAHQFRPWPGTAAMSALEYPSGRTYGVPNLELAKYFSGVPLDAADIPPGAFSMPYQLSVELCELKIPCDYLIKEAYGGIDERPTRNQAELLASLFALD